MFATDPALLSTLTSPDQLFQRLGGFWQNVLEDRELLRASSWARLQLHGDVWLRAVQYAAATSIQQVTPFVARQWRLVRLLRSQLTRAPNLVAFGDGAAFGDGTLYGQVAQRSYAWRLEEFADVGLLVDRILDPVHVFDLANSAFDPATRVLRFDVDPFGLIAPLPVYDDAGVKVDEQILLWARSVQEDHRLPWLRFGAVLGIPGQSSEHYLAVLRACWSMLVRGPSLADLVRGLMASAGLPWTQGGETVELITVAGGQRHVVTDRNAYVFHADATPLVAVGDRLTAGQALVDTVQVFEFGSGRARDYGVVPALAAGPDLIDGIAGTIAFPNADQTWQVQADGDVRCTLYGDAADLDAFWTAVHARGVAAGRTLAQAVGVTAPGLVVAVNPLEFVVEQVLGANLILVVVKPQHFLHVESGFLSRVKSLIPAGTLLLTQTTLAPAGDTLDLGGFTDSAGVYDAVLPPTDTASVSGTDLTYTDYPPSVTVA